jgi:hypothetical protein
MSISIAQLISLHDTLSCPNNSYVDKRAFVAQVGSKDHYTMFPDGMRKMIGMISSFYYLNHISTLGFHTNNI